MKKFLNFKTKVYRSKDYNSYLNSIEDNEEYDEADAWKKSLKSNEASVPTAMSARIRIDPDNIVAYIETCSLEAYAENPDNPTHDSLDIYLEGGIVMTVESTIEELEKQLAKINKA